MSTVHTGELLLSERYVRFQGGGGKESVTAALPEPRVGVLYNLLKIFTKKISFQNHLIFLTNYWNNLLKSMQAKIIV